MPADVTYKLLIDEAKVKNMDYDQLPDTCPIAMEGKTLHIGFLRDGTKVWASLHGAKGTVLGVSKCHSEPVLDDVYHRNPVKALDLAKFVPYLADPPVKGASVMDVLDWVKRMWFKYVQPTLGPEDWITKPDEVQATMDKAKEFLKKRKRHHIRDTTKVTVHSDMQKQFSLSISCYEALRCPVSDVPVSAQATDASTTPQGTNSSRGPVSLVAGSRPGTAGVKNIAVNGGTPGSMQNVQGEQTPGRSPTQPSFFSFPQIGTNSKPRQSGIHKSKLEAVIQSTEVLQKWLLEQYSVTMTRLGFDTRISIRDIPLSPVDKMESLVQNISRLTKASELQAKLVRGTLTDYARFLNVLLSETVPIVSLGARILKVRWDIGSSSSQQQMIGQNEIDGEWALNEVNNHAIKLFRIVDQATSDIQTLHMLNAASIGLLQTEIVRGREESSLSYCCVSILDFIANGSSTGDIEEIKVLRLCRGFQVLVTHRQWTDMKLQLEKLLEVEKSTDTTKEVGDIRAKSEIWGLTRQNTRTRDGVFMTDSASQMTASEKVELGRR